MRNIFVLKCVCIKFTFTISFKTISKLNQKLRTNFWFLGNARVKQEYYAKTPTSRGPPSKSQKTALTAEGGEMTHPAVPDTTSTVAFFDLSITSLKSRLLGL